MILGGQAMADVALTKMAVVEHAEAPQLAFAADAHVWYAAGRGLLLKLHDGVVEKTEKTPPAVWTGALRVDIDGGGVWVSPFRFEHNALVTLPPLPLGGNFELKGSAVSPDGKELVVFAKWRPSKRGGGTPSGPQQRLLVLEARTRKLVKTLWEGNSFADFSVIAVSDTQIAAGGVGITVFDRVSGHKIAELKHHQGAIRDLRFSADGATLVSAGVDKTVALWDMHNLALKKSWQAHDDEVLAVALDGHGRVASGGGDHQVKLWNAAGKLLGSVKTEGPIEGLAFSGDGTRLAAAERTARMYLFATAAR
jgi:hypothetical protein